MSFYKTFDEIIEQVLEHEGGYVDDPTDSGGETKYGISKKAYPNEDIKGLTVERAKELYKRDYWDRFKVDNLPDRIRHIYFDMCVNMGGGRATKILQEACNSKNSYKIDVDGGIGKNTIKAPANLEDFRLRAYRVMFYAELVMKKPEQMKFWVGWFRRSCEV